MTTNATLRPLTAEQEALLRRSPPLLGESFHAVWATLDEARAQLAAAHERESTLNGELKSSRLRETDLRLSLAASQVRVKRLEEALGAIVTRYDTTHVSAMELVSIARAALAAKEKP